MDRIPIFDGHNDTLLELTLRNPGEERGFFERGDVGHLDLPRAREGGFSVCYTPNPEDNGWTEESALVRTDEGYQVGMAPPLGPDYARKTAGRLTATLFELEAESEGALRVVRTAAEVERCLRDGVLAAILHFEGAENLGPDPDVLGELYERGLRSLGLV